MTGMPRNFRPIIGQHYSGPQLDRSLRRMPSHWILEEARPRLPAWWRYWSSAEALIGWLTGAVLLFAVITGITEARAAEQKPQVRKAAPINPAWSIKRCRDLGRTYIASSSDERPWKVRCTGRPVRT